MKKLWNSIFRKRFSFIDKNQELLELMFNCPVIIVAGVTGSGKSVLISKYLDYLACNFKNDHWEIVAYDRSKLNYSPENKNSKQLLEIYEISSLDEDEEFEIEESLLFYAEEAVHAVGSMLGEDEVLRLIHITESDLMNNKKTSDLVNSLVWTVNKYGKKGRTQLIYETSRIGEETIPSSLREAASIRVALIMPDEERIKWFFDQNVKAQFNPVLPGEALIKIGKSKKLKGYRITP